jgi:predicted Zn-dependent peptidase
VGAGSCYETAAESGISHFAEHLFFKGTQRRPTSKQISQDIEGIGGVMNGGTDKELTVFWCKVASSHFPIALDVLSDLLLNSRFDNREIERERRVISEEIKMGLDLPQQRVNALIDELLWPGQALGREVVGYQETVSSIAREQLLDYVARRYMPNNTVLSIAGDTDHEQAMAQVRPLLDKWAPGGLETGYVVDDKQTEARLRIEPRDIEQVHLCLAVHGLSHSHPQRFVLDLLNTALGGGMSSRLFEEIREQKGLAYDIHSYTEHFMQGGSLAVYAGVDPQKTETAVGAIVEQLSHIKQGITVSELARAKELSKGRLHLRLEDSRNVALWHGGQEILTQKILTIDDVVSIVDAIRLDQLTEVAEQILVGNALNLAITGPFEQEEPLRQRLRV